MISAKKGGIIIIGDKRKGATRRKMTATERLLFFIGELLRVPSARRRVISQIADMLDNLMPRREQRDIICEGMKRQKDGCA